MSVSYQVGFADPLRGQAALLYDQAFGRKIGVGIPSEEARLRVLSEGMNPSHAIAALQGGSMVGLVGFYDGEGSLTGGIGLGLLRRHLGVAGTMRAVAVLGWLERRRAKGQLMLDGIAVAPSARGQGIGTEMLNRLEAMGRERGFSSIRLDVVDTNPAARRLYERLGFQPSKTSRLPILGKRMGFSSSTVMVKQL